MTNFFSNFKQLKKSSNKGLIKAIIVIIIALIVLGYFGFNVEDIINSSTVQANLHSAWNFVVMIWDKFLSVPFTYIWDKIIVGILWKVIESAVSTAAASIN